MHPTILLLLHVYSLPRKHVYFTLAYQWPHVFFKLFWLSAIVSQYDAMSFDEQGPVFYRKLVPLFFYVE
jgi:hypothetical protein